MEDAATRRLLKETKFPPEYNTKVDMKKVNKDVMRSWITSRLTEILENDDDVVIETCCGMLLDQDQPEIKKIHLTMTGFLEKETEPFCKEMWKHCISAQNNPQGVSQELLDEKKVALLQEQADAARREEEARKAREARALESRDRRGPHREGANDRGDRERGDRPSYRGRGSFQRGSRGHHRDGSAPYREYRRRQLSRSRSPPRRRYRSRSRSRTRSRSRSPPRRRRSRSPGPPRRRARSPSPRRHRRRYESPSPPRHRRRTPRSEGRLSSRTYGSYRSPERSPSRHNAQRVAEGRENFTREHPRGGFKPLKQKTKAPTRLREYTGPMFWPIE